MAGASVRPSVCHALVFCLNEASEAHRIVVSVKNSAITFIKKFEKIYPDRER